MLLRSCIGALALLLMPAQARAAYRYNTASSMAQRSGEVIGRAAACGISDERLVNLGKTVVAVIGEVVRSPAELDRAQAAHEAAVARAAAFIRTHPRSCPAAISEFEHAERN